MSGDRTELGLLLIITEIGATEISIDSYQDPTLRGARCPAAVRAGSRTVQFVATTLAIQNLKRAESCMLRGGRTDVTAPKPVGFPVSEARLVGVGSMRPVDATNPRTLSVELTVSYCV